MRDWRDEIRRRLGGANLPPGDEAAVVEELGQHLDDRYAELVAGGLPDHRARAVVLDELARMDVLATELDRIRNLPPHAPPLAGGEGGGSERGSIVGALVGDVRYAVRSLRAQPAFSSVAVLTLALAIGACTLIFSAVNGVLLRPLPFRAPEELISFWGSAPDKGLPKLDFPEGVFAVYRRESRTVSSMAAFATTGFNLTGVGEPERLEGASVSMDFFKVMGVAPLLGRAFAAGEDALNASRVIVISHTLWNRRFGGDSAVIGRSIALNGSPSTIVGIMPASFDYPNRSELWYPLVIRPEWFSCWCYSTVARLQPGRTPDDAAREIAKIIDAFALTRPDIFPNRSPNDRSTIIAQPLSEVLVGSIQTPLMVLLSAVGLVLLIACANIANLSLARATRRARELAVRCCLGATPRRLGSQLLAESIVLSLAGAAAGAALAWWGVEGLKRLPHDQFPRMDQVSVDPMVFAFTVVVALLTGVFCGLAPAIQASRVNLLDAVSSGSRGTASGRSRRSSDLFVVVQFALSLVLLAGAGLLLRSYRHLMSIDPGFRTDNTVTARIQLPYPRYGNDTVVRSFYGELLGRIRALPTVTVAGTASRIPLSRGNPQDNIIAEGKEPKAGEPVLVANTRFVSADYFAAMGTSFVAGRTFQSSEAFGAPRVGIVDETLARHYWPNESAIGKRVQHGGDTAATRWITIVGVVRNVKHTRLDEKPDLQLYEHFAQRTTWTNYLVVRTSGSTDPLVGQIRREVAALDKLLPVFEVRTMRSAVDHSLATRRLTNVLLGGFAAVALLLATIGIYGVISVGVNGRVREFGIRMALGAQGEQVARLVLRRGVTLALIGVVAGLIAAAATTRFLRTLLFGVEPLDWISFSFAAVVLAATALAASYIPARRATRADPMLALRSE
jgi:putative ABC transport system permease protein